MSKATWVEAGGWESGKNKENPFAWDAKSDLMELKRLINDWEVSWEDADIISNNIEDIQDGVKEWLKMMIENMLDNWIYVYDENTYNSYKSLIAKTNPSVLLKLWVWRDEYSTMWILIKKPKLEIQPWFTINNLFDEASRNTTLVDKTILDSVKVDEEESAPTEKAAKKAETSTEEAAKKAEISTEEAAKKVATSTEEAAKKAATSTEEAAKKAETSTEEAAKKAETSTEEAAKKAATSTEEVAKKAATSTEEAAKKAATSTEEVAKKAATSTEEAAKKAVTSTENAAENAEKQKYNGARLFYKKVWASSEQLRKIQQALIKNGETLRKYGDDWKFWHEMYDAVISFQKSRGLAVDWKVWTNTLKLLWLIKGKESSKDFYKKENKTWEKFDYWYIKKPKIVDKWWTMEKIIPDEVGPAFETENTSTEEIKAWISDIFANNEHVQSFTWDNWEEIDVEYDKDTNKIKVDTAWLDWVLDYELWDISDIRNSQQANKFVADKIRWIKRYYDNKSLEAIVWKENFKKSRFVEWEAVIFDKDGKGTNKLTIMDTQSPTIITWVPKWKEYDVINEYKWSFTDFVDFNDSHTYEDFMWIDKKEIMRNRLKDNLEKADEWKFA